MRNDGERYGRKHFTCVYYNVAFCNAGGREYKYLLTRQDYIFYGENGGTILLTTCVRTAFIYYLNIFCNIVSTVETSRFNVMH